VVNKTMSYEPWPPDHYRDQPPYAGNGDGYQQGQWSYAGTDGQYQPRYDAGQYEPVWDAGQRQPPWEADQYEPAWDQPRWNAGQRPEPGWDAFDGNGSRPAGYADPRRYDQAPGFTEPAYRGGRHQLAARAVRGSPGVIAGAVMGFLAAGLSIGVATLAAAFFRPQASPIIAVGEAFIDRTPPALKNFAVEKFGENDKTMLLLGMYVTIALLAMAIGVLARKQVTIGVIGVAVFGLFGSFVAYTRPASKPTDVIPSIIGGIAGVLALLWLAHAAAPEVE
jgi:hypothetical protein